MKETSKNKREVEKKNLEPDNNLSTLKPKERWEIWLSLGNLLVTLIVGIGVAVFINYRNEKIQLEIIELQANIDRQLSSQQLDAQKQLIELQAENEKKSKTANIEITEVCAYYWGCDGVLEIKNLGIADASDIRIILYSPAIPDSWLPSIKDINAFSVRMLSPSINYTINQITVDTLSNSNLASSPNAFEIIVKDLSAGQNFYIITKPSTSLPLKKFEINRHVAMHMTEKLFYLDALRTYFNQQFAVATFNVELECQNCIVASSPSWFNVSSVESWDWDYVSESENLVELNIPITYFMPEVVNHIPETENLDLEVTSEYGTVLLQKIAP